MNSQFQIDRITYKLILIILLSIIMVTSCSPTPGTVVPTSVSEIRPTDTSVSPTGLPSPVATSKMTTIADDISKNVGKVMQVNDGSSDQQVIVFEETHDSPAGQVEIAMMMNRLYENYGLRQISLEGAFKSDGKLDTSWLPKDTPFVAKQPIRSREDVVVQLLQDGEISSSEAMTLIYNDMVVTGSEVADEYNYELSDDAASAPIIYLYLIAIPGMNSEEKSKANELLNAKKTLEGVEYIISTDDWTNKEYALIKDKTKIISAESWLKILDDIEAKAVSEGAEITSENKQAISDLRKFYVIASQRSRTMVNNTLAIVSPNIPVAMVIGAAHTELVVDLLTKKGVSFAVIRSNMLANNLENGDLSTEAYNRKSHQLSIDLPGTLGALLDGRKKPQPVINKTWLQSKYTIYIVADTIARAVASGKKPPFDDIIPDSQNVKVDKSSITIKGNVVFFSITAPDNKNKPVTIWVGVEANKDAVDKLLEDRLTLGRDSTLKKEAPNSNPETTSTELVKIPISSQSAAIFGTTKAAVESKW